MWHGMKRSAAVASSLLLGASLVTAQTSSTCNPLQGACPPDPALGDTYHVDFSSGSSDRFTPQGNPTFDSNGASFTIAKSGDSPQLTGKFYMMFGKLEVSVKAAPGRGIVSSVVMQSDDLDEIDWEWLGADGTQVQSNYFGKGQTTSYNRGAFHADAGNQQSFKKYTIDWNADQIVWQIDGTTVRAMRQQDAQGQYPQTPMQIKLGAWSGGDSSNAPGTVQWAGGSTDYSAGPYSMQVKDLTATDYSTGTQYKYNGNQGTWQSIEAVGGKVNPSGSGSNTGSSSSGENSNQAASPAKQNPPPAVTSTSPSMPYPFSGTHKDTTSTYTTPSIYPWVAGPSTLATSTTGSTQTSYPDLPKGWTVSSSGKVIPPSSAPGQYQASQPTPLPSSPPSGPAVAPQGQAKVKTSFNQQGFPVLVTYTPGAATPTKHYNDQGFEITPTPSPNGGGSSSQGDDAGQKQGGDASGSQQQSRDKVQTSPNNDSANGNSNSNSNSNSNGDAVASAQKLSKSPTDSSSDSASSSPAMSAAPNVATTLTRSCALFIAALLSLIVLV